jgi:hypothetical protein
MSNHHLLKTNKLDFVFENCDIHSLKITEEMYQQDFGKSIYQDFEFNFNNLVVGSGSIGQVYKCYSKSRSEYVAIKVKHPGINKTVNETVIALRIVCFILKYVNPFHNICMEYINNIYLQIDYIQEAENTVKLKNNFINESVVVIPEIYGYNTNFIIMSYHEGKKYNEVSEKTQYIASMYLNFIYLTSILVHDFLHADLHYGNWKIIEDPEIKILIYDCGIMCTTDNIELNRTILAILSSGRPAFIKLLDIFKDVEPKLTKRIDKYRPEFEKILVMDDSVSPNECFKIFIRKVLDLRLVTKKNLINLLTSIGIIGEAPKKSIDLFVKYILYPTGTNSLLYHIYIGILSKMNKFNELKNYYIDYLAQDPDKKKIYDDWLYEEFGHKKGYILTDIIYNLFWGKED